jgi:hypothetical protein
MLHKLRIQWNYWLVKRRRVHYSNEGWALLFDPEKRLQWMRAIKAEKEREHTRRQSGSGARQVPSGYDAQNDEIP